MKHIARSIAFLASIVVGCALSQAAQVDAPKTRPSDSATQPTTSPTTTPASGEPLRATVTGVEGLVQVRLSEDQAWMRCTVGQELTEGAEFRTGPRSAVRFVIPPDQTITLDRLGTVKLLQAIEIQQKVITDIGMKYGRTRYDIEAPGIEHQSTVRSPNSTLAVRGTKVALYDQRPFAPEAVSLTGRAEFTSPKRKIAFGGKNRGKARVSVEGASAELSLAGATVDPSIAFARTPEEERLVQSVLSQGAVIDVSDRNALPIVRGGIPPTDEQLALPGKLNFVLRWNADANLDFTVVNQQGKAGEILLPIKELSTTPSGGRIPFDHRGGPNGGIEIAFFGKNVPTGFYGFFVDAVSGSSDFTVDVFRENLERVQIIDQAANGGQGGLVDTLRGSVSPGMPGAGTVPIDVFVPLDPDGPLTTASLKSEKPQKMKKAPRQRGRR